MDVRDASSSGVPSRWNLNGSAPYTAISAPFVIPATVPASTMYSFALPGVRSMPMPTSPSFGGPASHDRARPPDIHECCTGESGSVSIRARTRFQNRPHGAVVSSPSGISANASSSERVRSPVRVWPSATSLGTSLASSSFRQAATT